jgi:hypothetical protein
MDCIPTEKIRLYCSNNGTVAASSSKDLFRRQYILNLLTHDSLLYFVAKLIFAFLNSLLSELFYVLRYINSTLYSRLRQYNWSCSTTSVEYSWLLAETALGVDLTVNALKYGGYFASVFFTSFSIGI